MPSVLEPELKTYERHKSELLGRAEGKYVLIHESEILGVFESKLDAINQGYERLGNVPFLVKRINQVDVPQNFVSGALAP